MMIVVLPQVKSKEHRAYRVDVWQFDTGVDFRGITLCSRPELLITLFDSLCILLVDTCDMNLCAIIVINCTPALRCVYLA